MRAAVPKVFPTTRHRLCYWHIKKKFGQKLGYLYYKKSGFKRAMKECLRFTFRIEDFERRWKSLIVKYGLTENTWLDGLYKDREAWVPVYNRTTFFAGMNTTGRNEGINSFFKDYICSTTTLKEFVQKYEQALKTIEVKERHEDFESEQKNRIVTGKSFILNHAAKIYTRKMYEKFRAQYFDLELYKANFVGGELNIYKVEFMRNKIDGENQHWIVKWNPQTCEGVCECHRYEFVGIPCAHLLKVLSKLDVYEIPKCFIKERWLKGANRFRRDDKGGSQCQEQIDAMNLSYLCQEATKWACIASRTPASYKIFLDGLRELGKKISCITPGEVVNEDAPSESAPCASRDDPSLPSAPCASSDDPSLPFVLLDPPVSRTKGRPGKKDDASQGKHGRYLDPMEEQGSKNKRKCHSCNSYADHDSRNCPSKKTKSDHEGTSMVEGAEDFSNT
ncbi:hypothetical protein IFM89_035305 [Coptis chinensis]|uniref:Protein FAR1-RELATED SEQUENCE n=1 Tax=Coptis chinensis TaxID=261450 RepID=A0A835IHL7_9MAGN|nr:hypothetical protein IFM89_035305 [Coptis chinensis]